MTAQKLLLVAAVVTGALFPANAVPAGSEKPAGILIFPRVEVDTAQGVDTVVQISNHAMGTAGVRCFYVDALGFCGSLTGSVCRSDADCPPSVPCVQECGEIDFVFTLTPGQTLGFRAGQGLTPPVIDMPPGIIVATQTDPFFGELKCVQVDPVTNAPIARNDLTGTVTIVHTAGPDAATYSAIGIESTGRNNGDGTLCLGSDATGECTAAEYARCPEWLNLDFFFEGAMLGGAQIENELTLVPCSQSLDQPPSLVTQVELVVFNEFEERRCGTFTVSCIGAIHFADHPLFSVGVQGTPAGHTRLMAVTGAETDVGHGLLGVAFERHVDALGSAHSAAHHLTSVAASVQADFIRLGLPGPASLQRFTRSNKADKLSLPRSALAPQRAP